MSLKFLTIPDKRLATSILATDTSFRVSNILGWDGEALEAADFASLHYVVFRNSTNTLLEIMEIDPSTIASGSITINKRGLQFDGDLTTEVTANKLLWVKGDTIISFGTNPPQIYQYLKEYIDGVAISGAPNASTTLQGLVEEATQAEVRARTAAGSLSRLFVNPSTLPNVLIQDYVASDTGTADAYAIAPTPAIVAYVAGQRFTFKAANDNTGTSTLAVNGLASPKTIKKADGATDLVAGDIRSGQVIEVEYDGTNFQMMSPIAFPVPVGLVSPFAGSSAPAGWLMCDGGAVSRTTYSVLFALINTTYGAGDGSTTFNLPDLKSRSIIGVGAGTKVATFASRSSNVITVTGLTSAANNEFQTGQAVVYHTTGNVITGLSNDTTYYIIKVTNTTFSLATSLANAQNGTVISLSGDGTGTQTFTKTLTARTLADTGGEENHAMDINELLSHTHATNANYNGGTDGGSAGATGQAAQNSPTGGNVAMNVMNPFLALNFIIKY